MAFASSSYSWSDTLSATHGNMYYIQFLASHTFVPQHENRLPLLCKTELQMARFHFVIFQGIADGWVVSGWITSLENTVTQRKCAVSGMSLGGLRSSFFVSPLIQFTRDSLGFGRQGLPIWMFRTMILRGRLWWDCFCLWLILAILLHIRSMFFMCYIDIACFLLFDIWCWNVQIGKKRW